MDSGRLDAHLSFLVRDPKDQYQFRGSLNHLQLEDINPFIEPNFNVKSKGTIHALDFNIHGADYDASALVNMEYDDLKIELINAKKHKKAWFKSALGNLVIKNHSKKKHPKEVEVYRVRNQKKSIYAQMVGCIMEALKKTVI